MYHVWRQKRRLFFFEDVGIGAYTYSAYYILHCYFLFIQQRRSRITFRSWVHVSLRCQVLYFNAKNFVVNFIISFFRINWIENDAMSFELWIYINYSSQIDHAIHCMILSYILRNHVENDITVRYKLKEFHLFHHVDSFIDSYKYLLKY